MNLKKGITFALITALISGVAIFLNGAFVVKLIKDPFVLTGVRNFLVAIFLSSVILAIFKLDELKKLKPKQWGQLILIGIIGGSIPFLLFFKGLSISQAPVNGAFLHKTLFLWVAVLAVIYLKEKLSWWQVGALGVLLAGVYLAGGPSSWQFGLGEKLVFAAVILWAIENIIAKITLKKLPAVIVAWGRMFFGSLLILIFLLFTHRSGQIFQLNVNQWFWVVITGVLLFGYVTSWFTALKNAPASIVTAILTLGFPITVILKLIFISGKIDTLQIIGLVLIVLGIRFVSMINFPLKELKPKHAKI